MSELMREMTDSQRLLHRLNMNGGDESVPLRRLCGEAHDRIRALEAALGDLLAANEAIESYVKLMAERPDLSPHPDALHKQDKALQAAIAKGRAVHSGGNHS